MFKLDFIFCIPNIIYICCLQPSCGNGKRRKRSTDKFGNKTVDIVFKISDPDEKQLLNNLGNNFIYIYFNEGDSHRP